MSIHTIIIFFLTIRINRMCVNLIEHLLTLIKIKLTSLHSFSDFVLIFVKILFIPPYITQVSS